MELYCHKVRGVLRPADEMAETDLDSIPEGALVKCKISRPRSLPHHRLFFGMLQEIYRSSPASERFPSFETFRSVVTIGAGYFEWADGPNGYRYPVAKSIAFHKMDQDEFNKFFDAAVDTICNKLHLVDEPNLRREFDQILGLAA